jgi:quinol monooxygenase YgiN
MCAIKRISPRLLLVILVALAAAFPGAAAFSSPRQASQPPNPPPPLLNPPLGGDLYVTTFIDILPRFIEMTFALCKQYEVASRTDPGFVRFEVLAQTYGRENHITLLAVWKTQKDYENHIGQAHTKMFREKMLPYLGAPFDERVSHLVPVP